MANNGVKISLLFFNNPYIYIDLRCKKLERVSLSAIKIHNFFQMCQKSNALKDIIILMESLFNIVDHLVIFQI